MMETPDLLVRRAAMTPDKIAMHDLISNERVTYGQFARHAAEAANLLASLGVVEGDRVGILCRNRIEFFEALFACAKIGALYVPLNWRMPPNELRIFIENCTPKVILAGAEDISKLKNLTVPTEIIELDGSGRSDFRALAARAAQARHREFWRSDGVWSLIYTSGTTGQPKAVIQTYQMALMNYVNIRQAVGFSGDDVTLNFLPLFHTAGINLYTVPFLFAGGEVKIMPGFDVERTMELLISGSLDAFFGVPAVYQELSLHPRFSEADLSNVRSWGCGGAPLPDILVETFAPRGALVCNGYGMTETGPTAFLMEPHEVTRKIGAVGRSQLLTAARIMVGDRPAKPGETGEMQMKGPSITPGYWRAPEATKAAFTDDGWLKTGDLALEDEEGFTYIVGRSKDMYISGGENVYPAEVENAYARHNAVLEAAVIGVPDTKWGEVGRAYLLMREGKSASPEDLTRFGRENLAPYKVPKSFVFVSDFPRTPAGKVQKHLLPRD